MLSELLQYAENKQCQMQPTQTTGDFCNMLRESGSLVWPSVSQLALSSTHHCYFYALGGGGDFTALLSTSVTIIVLKIISSN
jgi:hypothetical protein